MVISNVVLSPLSTFPTRMKSFYVEVCMRSASVTVRSSLPDVLIAPYQKLTSISGGMYDFSRRFKLTRTGFDPTRFSLNIDR